MALKFGRSVKNLSQLISANALIKIIGFVMVAVYARFLTKEELALIPVHALMGSLGIMFFGFGLQPTLLKMVPSRLEENNKEALGIMYTASTILAVGALLFSAGSFVLAQRLALIFFRDVAFTPLMRIIAIGAFFLSAREITSYVLWANARIDKISLILALSAVIRAILCSALLFLMGVKGVIIGLVLNDAICLLISLAFLRDLIGAKDVKWHSPWHLIKISLPFYFESYLSYFRGQGDQWIVATSLGPAAMGAYYVAKRVPQLLAVIRASLDKVMTPEVSRRLNRPDEMNLYLSKLKVGLFYSMIPLFMLIIGMIPLIIALVAGDSFSDAVIPASILCFWQLVQLLLTPASRGVFVMKPPSNRVLITTIETVSLLGALAVLAPRWQVLGVVISLLFSSLVAWLVAELFLKSTIGKTSSWGSFFMALIPSAAMTGLVEAMIQWNNSPLLVVLYAAVGVFFFILFQSVFNSKSFYGTLNSMAPIPIPDPFRWLLRRVH